MEVQLKSIGKRMYVEDIEIRKFSSLRRRGVPEARYKCTKIEGSGGEGSGREKKIVVRPGEKRAIRSSLQTLESGRRPRMRTFPSAENFLW